MERLPGRGDFGGQALVGPFAPDARSMHSDEPLFGMPPEALYVWGTLRDDEGDLHTVMRRIAHDGRSTSRRRFVLQTTMGGASDLRMHPCGRASAPHTDPIRELVDDHTVEWRSRPEVEGAPFRLRWANRTCAWVEEGVLDVTGTLIEPGMQWCVPHPDAGLAYISTIYRLEGTVLGRRCRGLIGFDQIHMHEGGEVYLRHDPLIEHGLEYLWYTWATCYEDGSLEAGHFMLGNERFGFGIVTDEHGSVRVDTDVDGEVTFDESGYWQTGARLRFDGDDYEFLPDERGRMPDLGAIPNPQVDGRWRRVGDTRAPDVWFAWGEAVPTHGTRPHRRKYSAQAMS